ncbi:hypothetical protein AK88_05551 [Plasmodium fragile]|uniref:Schizont-infected cell agglutination extracellular alpha domain-containing protein n=1 Tax=Plasmodium fragile TaxID=5857 RepID=A0A0D9QGG9_PLAFR|nr:uncharacterized protein AK88_05551 [Plasmodium fragile]KJP84816.1 hypothetical protein AK88_05551 [Plasmodium fragile]
METVLRAFVQHIDDTRDILDALAKNCENMGWDYKDNDTAKYMGHTVGDVLKCRLMVGALYFMQAWHQGLGIGGKHRRQNDADFAGIMKCILVNVFETLLMKYKCGSFKGPMYAWKIIDKMQMDGGFQGRTSGGECKRNQYGDRNIGSGNLKAAVKAWLRTHPTVERQIRQIQPHHDCNKQWKKNMRIGPAVGEEDGQKEQVMEGVHIEGQWTDVVKTVFNTIANEGEKFKEQLRERKRKASGSGAVMNVPSAEDDTEDSEDEEDDKTTKHSPASAKPATTKQATQKEPQAPSANATTKDDARGTSQDNTSPQAAAAAGSQDAGPGTSPATKTDASEATTPGNTTCSDSSPTPTRVSISCGTTSDEALGRPPDGNTLLEEADENKAGEDKNVGAQDDSKKATTQDVPHKPSSPARAAAQPTRDPGVPTSSSTDGHKDTEEPSVDINSPAGATAAKDEKVAAGTPPGAGGNAVVDGGNADPPPLNPPKPKPNPNPDQSGSSGSFSDADLADGVSGGHVPAGGSGSGAGAGVGGAGGSPPSSGPSPDTNQQDQPILPPTSKPFEPKDLVPYSPAIIPAVVGIGVIAFFLWKYPKPRNFSNLNPEPSVLNPDTYKSKTHQDDLQRQHGTASTLQRNKNVCTNLAVTIEEATPSEQALELEQMKWPQGKNPEENYEDAKETVNADEELEVDHDGQDEVPEAQQEASQGQTEAPHVGEGTALYPPELKNYTMDNPDFTGSNRFMQNLEDDWALLGMTLDKTREIMVQQKYKE